MNISTKSLIGKQLLNWLEMVTNDYIEVFGTSDTNADTFDINNLVLTVVKH